MKYPKKWIDTVQLNVYGYENSPEADKCAINILDKLAKVGALKDPPSPKEYWVSREPTRGFVHCALDCEKEKEIELMRKSGFIRVREVEEK